MILSQPYERKFVFKTRLILKNSLTIQLFNFLKLLQCCDLNFIRPLTKDLVLIFSVLRLSFLLNKINSILISLN